MSDVPGFNPDEFIANAGNAPAPATSEVSGDGGFDPDSFIHDQQQEQYGGTGQQLKAGLEGVAQGIAGPLAPLAETKLFGVKPEDIRGRAEANPITHGVGEAAGLTGGLLTGTGEAAVMTKAGELAASAAGLGKLAEGASYGARVGSAAVKQAAEMAVLGSGDEASKMILQDPEASAQSAIANIGLSAALGGIGGGLVAGVVSPLWEATAAGPVNNLLNGLKNHLDGVSLNLPPALKDAANSLGIELDPRIKAAMSGDPKAASWFNELRETQHPEIIKSIDDMHKAASDSVLSSLGVTPEAVEHYSEADAGHDLLDTFKKEYTEKYEPIAKQFDQRNKIAETINIPDESRLQHYGNLIERGIDKVGTDSPYYKLYKDYGDRLLAKDTIGGVDKLVTEINGRLGGMKFGADYNEVGALRDIKDSLRNFQEDQILKKAAADGPDILKARQLANQDYSQFAKLSDDLSSHVGLGEFHGAKGLLDKMAEKKAPEQLLRNFSPKNNADIIPFLQQHFPETLEAVRQNEVKQLIKPAVLNAKNGMDIDAQKLNKILKANLAGKADYVKFAIPEEAIAKSQAAEDLAKAIPSFKSSGTAGWQEKLRKHMPASALAAIGLFAEHSLVGGAGGYMLGEMAQKLGRNAPDAIKLAMLKFLSSDQPVEAGAFRSMVEFLHNSAKGQNLISKATTNAFKSGAQVLTESQMPNKADRIKLDKIVDKTQEQPSKLMQMTDGSGVGHYLPDHQTALTSSSATAIQYLQSLKPRASKPGPLDKEIQPTPVQEARYDRALDIAQQPAVVMQHIKDGTLQPTDIVDLKTMYPAMYNRMVQQVSNSIIHQSADEEPIPYRTKLAASMFVGQALDSTMQPASIMAAQPKPQAPAPQQESNGSKGRPSALKGKSTNMYKTPGQAAEGDRSDRD